MISGMGAIERSAARLGLLNGAYVVGEGGLNTSNTFYTLDHRSVTAEMRKRRCLDGGLCCSGAQLARGGFQVLVMNKT